MPEYENPGRSGQPIYRHIADDLRDQMRSGELAEDAMLPSEATLMDRYSTSQGTVRKALAVLRSEGWIVTQPGRGLAVRRRRALVRLANDRFARSKREAGRAAFDAEVRNQGLTPASEVVVDAPADAPADVAELLRLGPGEQVAIRRRRMLADGEPVQLANSYIPWSIADGTQIVQENSGPGGIYARIEEQGLILAEFEEEVCARAALPEEVDRLELPAGVPVILVTRLAIAEGDRPVEVCQHVMAADRHMLHYHFPAT